MRRALKPWLGVLALAAVAAAAAASASGSGLYGVVEKGPISPVCQADQPCDAPAQVTLLLSRQTPAGTRHYAVHTNASGAYRITLPPGSYTVATKERIGITRTIRPRRVHVARGRSHKLDFFIDTGIRRATRCSERASPVVMGGSARRASVPGR